MLKTLEYPNTYTYSATFLTTVGVNFLSAVKEFIVGLIGNDIVKKEKSLQPETTAERIKKMVGEVVNSSVEEHISNKSSSQTFTPPSRSSRTSELVK